MVGPVEVRFIVMIMALGMDMVIESTAADMVTGRVMIIEKTELLGFLLNKFFTTLHNKVFAISEEIYFRKQTTKFVYSQNLSN